MLASLLSLASLLVLAAAQTCPQQVFLGVQAGSSPWLLPGAQLVRRPIDVATNQVGFDINLWYHDGVTSLPTAAVGPVEAVTADAVFSNAFSANGAGAGFASAADLLHNGDEIIFIGGTLTVSAASATTEALLNIGSNLVIRRDGLWVFGGTHGLQADPDDGPLDTVGGATGPVKIAIRRYSPDGTNVLLDIVAEVLGASVERIAFESPGLAAEELPASRFDIGVGSVTVKAPTAPATTTLDNLLVLHGRGDVAGNFWDNDVLVTLFGSTRFDSVDQWNNCQFERWETTGSGTSAIAGTSCGVFGYAVPGCGTNNLKLKWIRTDFKSTGGIPAGQVLVAYNPDPNFISNFTSIVGVNVETTATVNGLGNFNGSPRQINTLAITHGQSNSIEFTATVDACTDQALPRDVDPISVGASESEIFLLRQSRLSFVVTDERPFDLQDLPIAAGCEVPFDFQIQVTNDGPSCVSQGASILDLDIDQGQFPTTVDPPLEIFDPSVDDVRPGTTFNTFPSFVSIESQPDAHNALGQNRSIVDSTTSEGLFSVAQPQPNYDFFRKISFQTFEEFTETHNTNLLPLDFDVRRFSDVRVKIEFDNDLLAGNVDGGPITTTATVTVQNFGCLEQPANSIGVQIQLSVPQGVQVLNSPSKLNPDDDYFIIDQALLPGEDVTLEFVFYACPDVLASKGGVVITAWIVSTNLDPNNDDDHKFTPIKAFDNFDFNSDNEFFNDPVRAVLPITKRANVNVAIECEEPVTLASIHDLAFESSSDDVKDVDVMKVTNCRVAISNSGISTIGADVAIDWVLPQGTRVARWSTDFLSQFVVKESGAVWAVTAEAAAVNGCPFVGASPFLTISFASLKHGTIELCAHVPEQSGLVTIDSSGDCDEITI